MSVNNYDRLCNYSINELDNYIYLYQFENPILNYITDDGENNGSSIELKGNGYKLYCESVTYNSTSSIDNRFSFENTLTVTLTESKEVTNYSVLKELITNNWMVVFKNKEGEAFVVNGEYPVMVSYSYVFNDEKSPNTMTVTFKALQNIPTIKCINEIVYDNILRDKPCEYNISRIKSLKMIDVRRASVNIDDDSFTLIQKGGKSLKTIEFNPSSLSFTDSFDGNIFTQTLTFQIPFIKYKYYFHYNLLEYVDNRYYALMETGNENYIFGGFRLGLFPSYTINSENDNTITITLTATHTTYSVLGSNTMFLEIGDGFTYRPMLGECIEDLYTYTLIAQYDEDDLFTNNYYCLEGYEEKYSSEYNIVGTYTRFDTNFTMKLIDYKINCIEGCGMDGLPTSIIFNTSGETKCFEIKTDCDIKFEHDTTALTVSYDETTTTLCVTSNSTKGTYIIKALIGDSVRYITVVIGNDIGGTDGNIETNIHINASGQTVNVIPSGGFDNINKLTTTLQYIINETGNGYNVQVPENPNETPRTFTFVIVYKNGSIETVNIIQDKMYYMYVSTEDTECDGNDLYYINKKYKGYSDDKIDILVGNVKGNQKESDSPNCMDYDRTEIVGTICVNNVLYNQVNYIKDDVVIATRLEKEGSACEDSTEYTEYRINTAITECIDDVAYYVEELWASADGVTYYKVYPTITRISETVAEDSIACQVIDGSGDYRQFRWVSTDDTFCLFDRAEYNCYSSVTLTYDENNPKTFVYSKGRIYQRIDEYIDTFCTGNFVSMGYKKGDFIKDANEDKTTTGGTEDSGTTVENNLEFEFSGDSLKYTLNSIPYTATTNPYSTYFADTLTNCQLTFVNSTLTNLIKFPDTSNVTYMEYMFEGCSNLTSLDLSSFDTSNVTSMYSMFDHCTSLTSLDLSNFDTSNVTRMNFMFWNCSSLTTLNLSNWDTSKVTSYSNMFRDCSSLSTVTVANCSDTTKQFILDRVNEHYTATLDGDTITVSH